MNRGAFSTFKRLGISKIKPYLSLKLACYGLLGVTLQLAVAETTPPPHGPYVDHQKVGASTIWLPQTGLSASKSKGLVKNLVQSLKLVQGHPVFESRLPLHWGVLLDPEWTKTSGYWSATLQTPVGDPAILLTPETVVDPMLRDSTLAHELTHLVHHRYRPLEENWVREGMALLAERLVASTFYQGLNAGFEEPESSLVASTDPNLRESAYGAAQSSQYGHLLQFFYYLYRVCGREALFDTLLTTPSRNTGVEFIGEALGMVRGSDSKVAEEPACASFEAAFRSFQVARFTADPSQPSGYVVAGPGHQAVVRAQSRKLPPYSASAYEISDAQLAKGKTCAAEEVRWGERRCIRIRLK